MENVWKTALCAGILSILTGCGGGQPLLSVLETDVGADIAAQADAMLAADPAGAITPPALPEGLAPPVPSVPPGLPEPDESGDSAAKPAQRTEQASPAAPTLHYRVSVVSPDAPEVAAIFLESAPLTRLASIPLYSPTGLEQRLETSLVFGQDVLRSQGYYEGRVSGRITPPEETEAPEGQEPGRNASPALANAGADLVALATLGIVDIGYQGPAYSVQVSFEPGPLYRTGNSAVIPAPSAAPGSVADALRLWPGPNRPDGAPSLPQTLADVGLSAGSPARAADILTAVDRVETAFHTRGYPFARIAATRHVIDTGTRELETEVRVASGPYARMGELTLGEEPAVRRSYLEYLVTWDVGEPWNQDKVEAFREALRGSALFQAITLEPAESADADGMRAVVADLEAAPARTVGGALKYDTTFGVGVQGFWEHRNLSGRGDSLRVDLPVWQDMQELAAQYRLPFFFSPKQDFIAQGGVLNQKTDAYDLQSGRVAAGVERRISRRWTATAMLSLEAGSIKEPESTRHSYELIGVPLGATWSDADSLLDATKGSRIMLSAAPYTGSFNGSFSALRTRIDAFTYLPLLEQEGKKALVLALRGAVGTVVGAEANAVPPSVRFYSGGGGSVRGYEFQSLGPRNDRNNPLGGSSVLELSVEPRWRISDTLGLVAFIDGGMVYDDTPDFEFGRNMRWGAGLGFRFYTAIGPLRFDVATPLNPRADDDFLHFYISIGQSF